MLIGALLITVAIILGVEIKSLLVGEGATESDVELIESAILQGKEAQGIIHMKTLYLGPDELMVGAKLAFSPSSKLATVASAVDAIEARIRKAVPQARVIYIEPDVRRTGRGVPTTTDAIVVKGLD
jgi:divalent metal cation (Fe/Co/Zn/Cd) transporter